MFAGLSKIESKAFLCYVSLRKLILRKNHIHTLHKQTFEALEKLTFLDVSYNRLMSLPNGIFDHQLELEYLKLNNNHLGALPSELFYFLNRLTYLELKFNLFQITFESSTFSKLQTVSYLSLRNANIQLLSNNLFSFLFSLKNLHLEYNDISTLDSNIFNSLTNLLHMNLRHNKLTRIGSDVFNLTTKLRELNLGHNHLAFLPADVFKNLVKLNYLKLSNNLFGSVAGNIHSKMSRPLTPNSFSSSKYLFEGHNIPSEVGTNQKLPITLKTLSLDHNMLSILHAGVFSNLIQLSHLTLKEPGGRNPPPPRLDIFCYISSQLLFFHARGCTHIFGRTGMCRSNGSLFYKKSLNMGPVFYPKILKHGSTFLTEPQIT